MIGYYLLMNPREVDLRRVDLNLLVAFDALMSERSVTRAARQLNIGQSAMSSTLARLRKLLDDPVLVRSGRELVATPFAESVAKQVREVLGTVESILARRVDFDPATATRTFTVIASDYSSLTFFTPLLSRLAAEAPGVRLKIAPPAGDYVERLRRNQVDVVVMPREVFTDFKSFPHQFLFSDRFVCAVDENNPAVGKTITLEQFSSLPYLATSCGHEVSPAEAQLDQFGITRNTEVTTAFGLAPILLSGTRMIALIHERLAHTMAHQTSLRLLEPPMPLRPINQLMLWNAHAETDPAHQWLRHRLMAMAAELDHTQPELEPTRPGADRDHEAAAPAPLADVG
jgi:DNA-binding transcriptional LysR family regulator